MASYVAFLRSINVGGHTVKMTELKAIFEEIGFTNVATLIASGNVLFETRATAVAKLASKIEQALEAALGYEVATFVRTPEELTAVANNEPFPVADGETFYIAFLEKPMTAEAFRKLQSAATEADVFHPEGRELYWLRRRPISESKLFGTSIERLVGQRMTVRNRNTVQKLVTKLKK